MATITIRNLDDEVHARLKRQAAENHRSLEAEVRAQLGKRAEGVEDWVNELRAAGEAMRKKYGDQSDSVALIRQIRDEE